MKVTRGQFDEAVESGLISREQGDALWRFLGERAKDTPGFHFTHILYYLGGLIAIGAMTLFMTLGWEAFGGWGLFFIALAYAGGGLWLTEYLLGRRLPIPAGITATFALALTPLAVYGIQDGVGLWAEGYIYREYHLYIDWRWLFMELATLAAGALLLWRYRLPFLVMPVAATLWYLSMDLTPFLFGVEDMNWDLRKRVSLFSGLAIVLLALWVDIRSRASADYAFWLYLFGVLAFWGGLSLMDSGSEWGKFLYLCVNLVMILIGALLDRRVFVVFGGLGVAGYLSYLAYDRFEDSVLFPFVLSFIGLGVIYLGILWQRHEARFGATLRGVLPSAVRALIERRG